MQFCPNGNPPCYKSKEEEVVIAQEDKIRLKIVGTRVDATGIVSFAAINSSLKNKCTNIHFLHFSLPLAH